MRQPQRVSSICLNDAKSRSNRAEARGQMTYSQNKGVLNIRNGSHWDIINKIITRALLLAILHSHPPETWNYQLGRYFIPSLSISTKFWPFQFEFKDYRMFQVSTSKFGGLWKNLSQKPEKFRQTLPQVAFTKRVGPSISQFVYILLASMWLSSIVLYLYMGPSLR